MTTNIRLSASEIIDFNLKVETKAKYFYSFAAWTPVMGALLLSGIEPTDHWRRIVEQADSTKNASLWTDQLQQLARDIWENYGTDTKHIPDRNRKHLRGLDGEAQRTPSSDRFQSAHKVLTQWGYKCEDEGKYLPEIEPFTFVSWLEELCLDESISFFDRTWLDAFLKLHGPKSTKVVLPDSVMQSLKQVTDAAGNAGYHPLAHEILQAQREARSRGRDPHSIKVIFPLLSRLLDDQDAIDRASEQYVAGRVLPVTLEDGARYVLRRTSLRVYLNRGKARLDRLSQQ